MSIHHSLIKKAEKLGATMKELQITDRVGPLSAAPEGTVEMHWPQFNVYAYGVGGKAAMSEMEALVEIKAQFPTCHIQNSPDDGFLVNVWDDTRALVLSRDYITPTDALLTVNEGKPWLPTEVPLDGGDAHKAGFSITENPHDEEEEADDFAAWDAAWESSADEADAEDNAEEGSTGSVVSPKYRTLYAEQGHPNHCGDWLAETLNNLVLGQKTTDIVTFEAICAENGVDTSKYNHSTPGWQGRVRMTGRNLLARKVYEAGKLALPHGLIEGTDALVAPADWMSAQRFKSSKKAEA